METTAITINMIWKKRGECAYNNGKYPDNVMLHPSQKRNIESEVMQTSVIEIQESKKQRLFGMKVIWTYEIEETDIIFTYNSR